MIGIKWDYHDIYVSVKDDLTNFANAMRIGVEAIR